MWKWQLNCNMSCCAIQKHKGWGQQKKKHSKLLFALPGTLFFPGSPKWFISKVHHILEERSKTFFFHVEWCLASIRKIIWNLDTSSHFYQESRASVHKEGWIPMFSRIKPSTCTSAHDLSACHFTWKPWVWQDKQCFCNCCLDTGFLSGWQPWWTCSL